jgi:hypothetical protein
MKHKQRRGLRIERLETRDMFAVLSVATPSGPLSVDVDGYGSFGRSQQGTATGDAILDGTGTIYESVLALGTGDANTARLVLSDGSIGAGAVGGGLQAPSVSVNGATATSQFSVSGQQGSLSTLNGLQVTLTQTVTSVGIGALLTQVYSISNPTGTAKSFDVVRYADVDVDDTGDPDGGGRLGVGGTEWLVTTSNGRSINGVDTYVAVRSIGGAAPAENRYEVSAYSALLDQRVISGGDLRDAVFDASDNVEADSWIEDTSQTYDNTLAWRNLFTISAGGSATYTTYTFFASAPVQGSLTAVTAGDPVPGAPKVTDVILRRVLSPNTIGAGESYAAKIAAAPNQGRQLVSSSVVYPNTVQVKFSELVRVQADHLQILNLSGAAAMPSLESFSPPTSENGLIASWRFSGPVPFSQFMIDLSDDVRDMAGNRLDGEWTNPGTVTTTNSLQSEFPSGNGVAGGRFQFVAVNLFTLVNNTVDADELSALLSNWGSNNASGTSQGDFTGDGKVDANDLSLLLANWGMSWANLNLLRDLDDDFDVDASDILLAQQTDVNGDGSVNSADIDLVMEQFGLGVGGDFRVVL